MNKLSKDGLYSIAIMLNFPDLLAFCNSNPRINSLVCENNDIWFYRLSQEYPEINYNDLRYDNPRQLYQDLRTISTEIKKRRGNMFLDYSGYKEYIHLSDNYKNFIRAGNFGYQIPGDPTSGRLQDLPEIQQLLDDGLALRISAFLLFHIYLYANNLLKEEDRRKFKIDDLLKEYFSNTLGHSPKQIDIPSILKRDLTPSRQKYHPSDMSDLYEKYRLKQKLRSIVDEYKTQTTMKF